MSLSSSNQESSRPRAILDGQPCDLDVAVDLLRRELCRALIGKEDVIELVLACVLARGHLLFDDLPGLGKTTLAKVVARAVGGHFARVQCTPDLLPTDITGFNMFDQKTREFEFRRGPVFSDVLLADEINRTPPKTQAALLEAMQEHQVTAAGQRYVLEEPFFVLATQNPIEMEGTYPLPEAQLDRFLFNVQIDYLPPEDELAVVMNTTSTRPEPIEPIFTGNDVVRFHETVRKVPIAQEVAAYAVRLAAASRPGTDGATDFVNDWVSWGAGLRGAQTLVLGAKARAILAGRSHVTLEDIQALVHPAFRHRILIGYKAEAEGISVDRVIDRLLDEVPTKI
ncbi:MAG: AAA family ATPase [Planctomycetales bacterium]|nr:AAA family ATPase [Planctomycetales bacterium]